MKIDSILETQYHLAQRYNTPFGIIMLDIDHFKNINDTYGHLVGDEVLKQLAKILKQNVRDTDSVGRWGGEEFLIICPSTEIEAVEKVAQNLRIKIQNHDFSNGISQITSSFGIACYKSEQNLTSLIKEVDDALYLAKENGRNQVARLDV
jgi:diguanylate cyclase (GGDEF)-like protein